MRRGTTPTLEFELEDVDLTNIKIAMLTIKQDYKNVINQELEIDTEREILHTSLTQEQTLLFKPGPCKIQIKVEFLDGMVSATDIQTIDVRAILNEEIMS